MRYWKALRYASDEQDIGSCTETEVNTPYACIDTKQLQIKAQ